MFEIIKQSKISKARLGQLTTPHGVIDTPFFMPDATRGAVKSLSGDDLVRLGLPAMVVNTYHLYFQPGLEVIKKAKGAHQFMHWSGPLLSDSGGYQVFSLIHKNSPARSGSARAGKGLGKITDEKVIFRSPLDGSSHDLTPEKSIQIQFELGADMLVCLDDCPPNDAGNEVMAAAINRTIAWAKRCRVEFARQVKKRKLTKKRPLLFGVIQGGANLELRKKCAEALFALGFDGYGFGARHVDKAGVFLDKPLRFTADLIPPDKLRFGLGIGAPADIVRAVKMGWDMFDCVIPTREARHGKLYAGARTLNITNAKFKKDFSPINKSSKLPELKQYTKSYLHHLFKIGEPLALRLSTLNNLEFYLELMRRIRQSIRAGRL